MQKIYLSRAMTRAMALDHPIGDPTGGPAYRETREPISATIAIGTMASTYAAAGSFAAMSLFSGLAFAGAAVSLIGNITGNKTLSKIGMIAGIAGGVGALAEGALGFSSGTLGETFGFGEAAANAAGAGASLAGSPAAEISAQGAGAAGPLTPVVDGVQTFPVAEPSALAARSLPPVSPTAGAVAGPSGAAVPLAGATPTAPAVTLPGNATAPLSLTQDALLPATDTMVKVANNSVDPIGSLYYQMGGNVDPSYMDSIRKMTPMESAWEGVKDFGRGTLDLVKSNPGAAMMVGQMVGGVSEWLSGVPDAELDALQSQVGLNDARAMAIQEEIAREKQRRANLNAGYAQVNANVQVNPNVTIPLPWQQQQAQANGLINGARAPMQA